ncbi:Rz1-like lysis system protein LysC [Pseudomonas aeruginosa]|uniref:Rz1-like lysis system protein LysC n=1 Tax=Pseudomonas aeruginosa TaxID=287 RepID=UPI001C31A05C|nr:Rz1-like lysis system protein LysC [Pseudomonas aeruginosa]
MTKLFATGCVLASLLALAGCTPAPKPLTPAPTAQQAKCPLTPCPLTPCRLPGRPPLANGEDATAAIDAVEAALTACAVQVLDCIERQRVDER